MFGSACLQQQALDLAAHAFVACQDFVVHPGYWNLAQISYDISSCIHDEQWLHLETAEKRGSM